MNHRFQAYWESQGIDWKMLAVNNLGERSKGTGATLFKGVSGNLAGIVMRRADGMGPSRLLFRNYLAKQFPQGYRVALPDRTCGLAFAADLGDEDRNQVPKIIDSWYTKGPLPFASGTFLPDDLLPATGSSALDSSPSSEIRRAGRAMLSCSVPFPTNEPVGA